MKKFAITIILAAMVGCQTTRQTASSSASSASSADYSDITMSQSEMSFGSFIENSTRLLLDDLDIRIQGARPADTGCDSLLPAIVHISARRADIDKCTTAAVELSADSAAVTGSQSHSDCAVDDCSASESIAIAKPSNFYIVIIMLVSFIIGVASVAFWRRRMVN